MQDCEAQKISVTSLMKYYKPGKVPGYCTECPRYGLNWSCPPHDFDRSEFVERFTNACVISIRVDLSDFSGEAEAMDCYYQRRDDINSRLHRYEEEQPGSVVLIAGYCNICDPCTRKDSLECACPDQLRYSFESLGFDVSEMVKDLFDVEFEWSKEQTPRYMYIVAGILSNMTLDAYELRDVLKI